MFTFSPAGRAIQHFSRWTTGILIIQTMKNVPSLLKRNVHMFRDKVEMFTLPNIKRNVFILRTGKLNE
jgi:hypothetical protein